MRRCRICGLPRKGHTRHLDATALMTKILASALYNGQQKVTISNRAFWAHFVYEQAQITNEDAR